MRLAARATPNPTRVMSRAKEYRLFTISPLETGRATAYFSHFQVSSKLVRETTMEVTSRGTSTRLTTRAPVPSRRISRAATMARSSTSRGRPYFFRMVR